MSHARPGLTTCSQYDAALHALSAARQRWAETSVNRRLALLRQIKDAPPALPRRGWPRQRRPKGCRRAIRWRGGVAGGPLRANGRLQRAYRHLEQLEEKTFLRRIRCGRWRTAARRCGWCPARSGIGCFCLVFALRYGCSRASPGPSRPLCGAGIRHPACRAAGQAGAGAWRRQCGLDCATGCATQAVY